MLTNWGIALEDVFFPVNFFKIWGFSQDGYLSNFGYYEVFTYLYLFRQPGNSEFLIKHFRLRQDHQIFPDPISAFGFYMPSGFSRAGYSLTTDQIFSHIFCSHMASQPHDSADEAQILCSLGRFSHILDTWISSSLYGFLHGDSDESFDGNFFHTENMNKVSLLYGFAHVC